MIKTLLILLAVTTFMFACRQNTKEHAGTIKPAIPKKTGSQQFVYDTSLVLFNDAAYKARITIKGYADTDTGNRANTSLTLVSHDRIVFKDSLNCNPAIFRFEFKDMNNDGVKDLLLLQNSSARSTEFFHLYVMDGHNKKLTRIKGFDQVPNATLDTTNNIITGSALWGRSETTSFYRISRDNKLIQLWPAYDAETGSNYGDIKYEKAIKGIIKKWGKK